MATAGCAAPIAADIGPMGRLLPSLLVLLAGAVLAAQAPTNAALARTSGSVVLATLTSFVVGLVALLLVWGGLDRTSPMDLRGAPAWAWAGGLYGALYVAALAFGAPRLGLAATLTLAIAGQLVAALAIDRLGLFGLRVVPLSAMRVAGMLLMLGGVVLVRRG